MVENRVIVVFLAISVCANIWLFASVYLNSARPTASKNTPVKKNLYVNAPRPHSRKSTTSDGQLNDKVTAAPNSTFEAYNYKLQNAHSTDSDRADLFTKTAPTIVDLSTSLGSAGENRNASRKNLNSVEVPFDPYGKDTIVYLHIQKTGGTVFLEHLVTAHIPDERLLSFNYSDSQKFPPKSINVWHNRLHPEALIDKSRSQYDRVTIGRGIPLCRTSRYGGWKRGDKYWHHEMCPKNWERPNGETWLISEKTTDWNCGVHAFYTDFKRCLENSHTFNRKVIEANKKGQVGLLSIHSQFHYVVLLRHPLLRYISEYLHVSRGACWRRDYFCADKQHTLNRRRKPPPFGCPDHFQCNQNRLQRFLSNLTLEKFAKCQDSWSANRMTISLADDIEATCWNKSRYTREQREQLLLTSAKSNLLNFSYFGISEFLSDSGVLFEKTFGVMLQNPVRNVSLNTSYVGKFIKSFNLAEKEIYNLVVDNNHLDLELYNYALEIFKTRMKSIGRELDTSTLHHVLTMNKAMQSIL